MRTHLRPDDLETPQVHLPQRFRCKGSICTDAACTLGPGPRFLPGAMCSSPHPAELDLQITNPALGISGTFRRLVGLCARGCRSTPCLRTVSWLMEGGRAASWLPDRHSWHSEVRPPRLSGSCRSTLPCSHSPCAPPQRQLSSRLASPYRKMNQTAGDVRARAEQRPIGLDHPIDSGFLATVMGLWIRRHRAG